MYQCAFQAAQSGHHALFGLQCGCCVYVHPLQHYCSNVWKFGDEARMRAAWRAIEQESQGALIIWKGVVVKPKSKADPKLFIQILLPLPCLISLRSVPGRLKSDAGTFHREK